MLNLWRKQTRKGFFSFRGGVHPPERKEGTRDKRIENAPLPQQVTIPLCQHLGASAEPLVSPGDKVKAGEIIGRAAAYISAPVHSSISGEVTEIKVLAHPLGLSNALSVVIKSDGKDEWVSEIKPPNRNVLNNLTAEKIKEIIKEAGIVGLGGAQFPTHIKLSPPKSIDTYVLNGAECEPYLTCDERLMIEEAESIIDGFQLLMKVANVRKGYIGIEDNKPEAIKRMSEEIRTLPALELRVIKTKYPQGGERQLIKALLGRNVPSGSLPFEVGVLVSNVGTAFAVAEAAQRRKPLVERIITITGSGVMEPKNLRVRIGTLICDLISNNCGGYRGEPGKVITGGPMMGTAQWTDEIPVIKGTSGILVQIDEDLDSIEYLDCIRCGKCTAACPVSPYQLMPNMIFALVERERFAETEDYGLLDCIECGACAYVCPARIPLVQSIKYAKSQRSKKQ
jgi:electron transport complex protein RnfC